MGKQIQYREGYAFRLCLLLPLFLLPNSLFAQQQLLGIYEFAGKSTYNTRDNFSAVTKQPPFATFSNFSRSDSIEWITGNDVYNNKSWATVTTFDPLSYIEFTVTVRPGYQLNFNEISFDNRRTTEGPKNIRIAHNFNSNFDKYFDDFEPLIDPKSKAWNFEDFIIRDGGSVTFRIYGWNANKGTGAFRVDNVALYGTVIPNIRINEFHYANTANTGTGFVEVTVPKSFTALNTITLSLYSDADNNGFGDVYKTETLNKFQFIDTTMYDDYNVFYLNVPEGLSDPRGGISLTTQTDFIQFLSYGAENGLEAIDGPAAGQKSTDVGETESADDGPNNAIYLSEGRIRVWTNNENGVNSKGYRNGENNDVLPVELKYFNGIVTPKGVLLFWATATEKDNDRFVVERSSGSETNFLPIAEVKGQGNTLQEQKYQILDQKALIGTTYYRLKQIDFDGKFSYSRIIALKGKELTGLSIYPNPVTTDMRVTYEITQHTGPIQLLVYNSAGRLFYQKEYTNNNLNNTISLSLDNLPAGMYSLVLIIDGKIQTERFIKL